MRTPTTAGRHEDEARNQHANQQDSHDLLPARAEARSEQRHSADRENNKARKSVRGGLDAKFAVVLTVSVEMPPDSALNEQAGAGVPPPVMERSEGHAIDVEAIRPSDGNGRSG